MAARQWTEEQRRRQGDLIRTWSPWKLSTGPKTVVGKGKASRNAYKGGARGGLRDLATALRALTEWQQGIRRKVNSD
jgi:hypothetical protein